MFITLIAFVLRGNVREIEKNRACLHLERTCLFLKKMLFCGVLE